MHFIGLLISFVNQIGSALKKSTGDAAKINVPEVEI
jgi:hypothetical protein